MKPSVAFVILMCLCEAVAVPRALSGNVKDVFRLEKRQQDTGTSDGELLMIFWHMPAELIDNSAQFPGCILCGCTFRRRVSSLFLPRVLKMITSSEWQFYRQTEYCIDNDTC